MISFQWDRVGLPVRPAGGPTAWECPVLTGSVCSYRRHASWNPVFRFHTACPKLEVRIIYTS